ncbi:FG-GAP-like repeat-containing protein [Terrabacter sp. Ter38]|uniref:FG-GAP-like repeat-containing protein n=1 Tax=Terrabacter sp. Ter38 TaxID=2926030 RepID=UPI0021173917|nr:FG-GAP-like repeat-containing protein [Terrabacter sp. Ter38]
MTPSYSPDGRLLAATIVNPETGRSVIEVRRARTRAVVFTVDLGPDVAPADSAFSPDGQTLAYTRYDAATGEPLGLGLVDVLGAHTTRVLTFDVPVAEPAWRADGTSLVVTAFDTAEGLSVVCVTCTKSTPINGTSGGYSPEVAPDGTIWFISSSGAASLLRKRVANGTASTVRSSTTVVYSRPRQTPDGTIYVGTDTPSESDPAQSYFEVVSVSPAGAASDGWTPVQGWQSLGRAFYGYDMRQVPSPGTAQFTGNGNDDLVARDGSGNLWAYAADGGRVAGRVLVASGWQGMNAVVAAGDLTRDGRADVVARDGSGRLWLYRGLASGKLAARTGLGSGWNGYTILGVGDWNGDDNADLVARDGAGTLWLYPGNGRGGISVRTRMGSGWGGMTALVASGDIDFDARADLIARDRAGVLWLYPGNGATGFLSRRQLGTGWGSFTAMLASEITNGRADLWVRTSSGQLISWDIGGDGAIISNTRTPHGYGWNGMLLAS